MGFLNRLFGRQGGEEPEPFTVGKFMEAITQLSQDVDKALRKNDPRLKSEATVRVDHMIDLCQQFSQRSEDYVTSNNRAFVLVDMSKRQQLATSMLPLLANMKDRLNR